MAILTLSADEARSRLIHNPHSRWYKGGIDVNDVDGDFAVQRVGSGYFSPSLSDDWVKGLEVPTSTPVFAIGSCFARGIELALNRGGFNVLSYASEFDEFELANAQVTGRGFTNKYTTFAIENELRWALDPETPFPTASLVQIGDGTVIDPHVNPTLKWLTMEPTVARHETISVVYRRAAQAPLIVITLGLVESWTDVQEGQRLNISPTAEMMTQFPGRYEFEVTNFAENRATLDRISRLLAQHGHPDTQIVVTVSPVPLMATFSGRDVVAANAYSKSLLRTAAEEWCFDEPNVHYFPSYEIVTNSADDHAWEQDGRHVQGATVAHIMSFFKSSFVQD